MIRKKLSFMSASAVLALVLVFSFATAAFADDFQGKIGTLTSDTFSIPLGEVPPEYPISQDVVLSTNGNGSTYPVNATSEQVRTTNTADGVLSALPSVTMGKNDKATVHVSGKAPTQPGPFSLQEKWTVHFTNGNGRASTVTVTFTGTVVVPKPADTTAPVVTATPDRAPDSNGWYNHDVIVRFTADDGDGSGVASVTPSEVTVNTEGVNTYTVTAIDKAGNEKTYEFTYKLDKSKPTVTATPDRDPNSYGWYNKDVTVSFSAVEEAGGSDVDKASISEPVTVSADGANQEIGGYATDNAGNQGYGYTLINLDQKAPTISSKVTSDSPISDNGWYKDEVTVHFEANDTLSGVDDSTLTPDKTFDIEGADQNVTGSVYDKAGNYAETELVTVNVDTTLPTINLTENRVFKLNEVVAWKASDTGSGLATPESGTIDTSKVGTFTVSIPVLDNVGHDATLSVTYKVEYVFADTTGKTDNVQVNSAVPVTFSLTDANGAPVKTVAHISLTLNGVKVDVASKGKANTGDLFKIDSLGVYTYTLDTKSLKSKNSYLVTVTLDDGSELFTHVITTK